MRTSRVWRRVLGVAHGDRVGLETDGYGGEVLIAGPTEGWGGVAVLALCAALPGL